MKKNIAVVGVSHDPDKFGQRIFRDLLKEDYAVFGVNLKGGNILGQEIYPCLEEVPEKIDTVITVVPPEESINVIAECRLLGIKEIWFQPGSESIEVINLARSYRMKFHTRCFMVAAGIW